MQRFAAEEEANLDFRGKVVALKEMAMLRIEHDLCMKSGALVCLIIEWKVRQVAAHGFWPR